VRAKKTARAKRERKRERERERPNDRERSRAGARAHPRLRHDSKTTASSPPPMCGPRGSSTPRTTCPGRLSRARRRGLAVVVAVVARDSLRAPTKVWAVDAALPPSAPAVFARVHVLSADIAAHHLPPSSLLLPIPTSASASPPFSYVLVAADVVAEAQLACMHLDA